MSGHDHRRRPGRADRRTAARRRRPPRPHSRPPAAPAGSSPPSGSPSAGTTGAAASTAALAALRLSAPRHGAVVHGALTVPAADAGGRLEVDLLAARSALAAGGVRVGQLERQALAPGPLRFSVTASARARRALRRHGRLVASVVVHLGPPAGAGSARQPAADAAPLTACGAPARPSRATRPAARRAARGRRAGRKQPARRSPGLPAISGATSPMLCSRRIVLPICRSAAFGCSPPEQRHPRPSRRRARAGPAAPAGRRGRRVACAVLERHRARGERQRGAQPASAAAAASRRRRSSRSRPGSRRKAASISRRGTAWSTSSPQRSASSTRSRAGSPGARQQRRLGHELVEAAHDRPRADEPLRADPHAGHGRAAVEQRTDQRRHDRQQIDAPVVDALERERGFDRVARVRARQDVELGACRHLARRA